MNENEMKNTEAVGETDNDLDVLKEFEEFKKNSVSKEEYNKQVEKNKLLMRQIISGGGTRVESDEAVDLEDIRNKLFGNPEDMSDLDFWRNTLTLRKERLEKEGVDIFLPKGKKTRYSNADKESANHVAEVIGQLIEESDGSPQVFKALLNNAIE